MFTLLWWLLNIPLVFKIYCVNKTLDGMTKHDMMVFCMSRHNYSKYSTAVTMPRLNNLVRKNYYNIFLNDVLTGSQLDSVEMSFFLLFSRAEYFKRCAQFRDLQSRDTPVVIIQSFITVCHDACIMSHYNLLRSP